MEELAEDLDRLTRRVDRLRPPDKGPFVRMDLFNSELRNINQRLDGMHTMMMWTLGILATCFVAGVVTIIGAVAKGGFG